MRKSSAPSLREKRFKFDSGSGATTTGTTKNCRAAHTHVETKHSSEDDNFFENKAVFNAVWREASTKKHKTWKGDGIITINLINRKAVLKDHMGKYIGATTIKNQDAIEEDLQLDIGGKEVQLLERITSKRDYFDAIKRETDDETWGEKSRLEEEVNEMKKPKASFVFRPSMPMSALQMPAFQRKEERCMKNGKVGVAESVMAEPEQSEELCISLRLQKLLRPHQREGVQFLYDCLMGHRHLGYFGCILADEMGLGKTLQCLTAVNCMLRTQMSGGGNVLSRVLIVTPSTLTSNWNREVEKWLKSERVFAFVVGGKHKLSSYALQHHIPFVIVSYELLHGHIDEFKKLKFDMLICDEGHRLKNQDTKIYSALCDLGIDRRLILSGTPVQNNLREFFTLADFVNPGIFGTYQYFRKYYETPIEQSQSPVAPEDVRQLGAERSKELNELSSTFLLRRSQQINRQYLGKKQEYICFVRPSELQQLILENALELYRKRSDVILKQLNSFQIITILKKICNNPSSISDITSSNYLTKKLERLLPDFSDMSPMDSSKMHLVENFLHTTALTRNEKCVIVSNYTKTLNALQGLCDYMQIKCLRLDGSTPLAERNRSIDLFNTNVNGDDLSPLVFLLSAKAGGVGINLTGASRLILFDNDWNPAVDAQAVSRIWRDGQQRDVQIYRLITAGCIEEKIFQRQIAKMSLGDQVLHSSSKNETDAMTFTPGELLDLFSVQYKYDTSLTHENLQCGCNGEGQNLVNNIHSRSESKEINELMRWRHYGAPFDESFLTETCLCDDNLLYIFANQNEID